MGKSFLFCVIVLAALAPKAAYSRKANRLHLPEMKKASRQKRKAAHARWNPPMPNETFSRELRESARENPWSSKFYSRTVYYFRSDSRIPESYNCDSAIEEKKMAEAQAQALSECENSGLAFCQLAKVLVSKNGALQCRDFPNHRCPSSGFYRGCVAEALVLGENKRSSPGRLSNEEAGANADSEI